MDPYESICALYDLEHDSFTEDADFYLQLVGDGPVLEVAAGTGRVMLPLAKAGLEVWGVDPSASMLARASHRLQPFPHAHLVQSTIQDLDIDVRFNAMIFSLNSLWHLPSLDDQLEALRVARRHLLPGAVAIVDLTNPLTMADRGAVGEVRQRFQRRHEGRTVTGFSACHDDEAEQHLALSLWYDDTTDDGEIRRATARLDLRYLYRWESELLIRLAGFVPTCVYGSYDLDSFEASSSNIILTARTP